MDNCLSEDEIPIVVRANRKGVLENTYDKLGSGSFGVVFRFISTEDPSEQFAVKMEKKQGPHNPQLRHEYKVYKELDGVKNYPNIWGWYEYPTVFVLVMELLGSSVEDLFRKCRRKFSVVTACLLADQFLDRIEGMHSCLLVHRDIKPSNFVIGRGDRSDVVFLVDFGLTTRYRDKRTLKHKYYSEWRSLIGTARYASINNHRGIQYSRRDDLESLAYCLIYFLRGNLPWQGLAVEKDAPEAKAGKEKKSRYDRYRAVLEKKQSTSVEELCEGMPVEFQKFLVYAKNLGYEADPDYDAQRSMFHQLFEKESKKAWGSEPPRWDWVIRAEQKAAEEAEVERRKRELQQARLQKQKQQQAAKNSAKSATKRDADDDKMEQEEEEEEEEEEENGGAKNMLAEALEQEYGKNSQHKPATPAKAATAAAEAITRSPNQGAGDVQRKRQKQQEQSSSPPLPPELSAKLSAIAAAAGAAAGRLAVAKYKRKMLRKQKQKGDGEDEDEEDEEDEEEEEDDDEGSDESSSTGACAGDEENERAPADVTAAAGGATAAGAPPPPAELVSSEMAIIDDAMMDVAKKASLLSAGLPVPAAGAGAAGAAAAAGESEGGPVVDTNTAVDVNQGASSSSSSCMEVVLDANEAPGRGAGAGAGAGAGVGVLESSSSPRPTGSILKHMASSASNSTLTMAAAQIHAPDTAAGAVHHAQVADMAGLPLPPPPAPPTATATATTAAASVSETTATAAATNTRAGLRFALQRARACDIEFLSVGIREAERAHTGIGMYDILAGTGLSTVEHMNNNNNNNNNHKSSGMSRSSPDKVSLFLQHACLNDSQSHIHFSRFLVMYDTSINKPVACACAFPYPELGLTSSMPGFTAGLKESLGFSEADCKNAWKRCEFMREACPQVNAGPDSSDSRGSSNSQNNTSSRKNAKNKGGKQSKVTIPAIAPAWRIDAVYVKEEYRRQGLMKQLLTAIMQEREKFFLKQPQPSQQQLSAAVPNPGDSMFNNEDVNNSATMAAAASSNSVHPNQQQIDRPCMLGCAVGNEHAKALYEQLGFRVVGEVNDCAACQAALNCPGFILMMTGRSYQSSK